MPSRNRTKNNESPVRLKQTTLFDNLASISTRGKHRLSASRSLSPSKKRTYLQEDSDSSDEIAAISFAPVKDSVQSSTPHSVSSRGSSPAVNPSLKGKSRRVLSLSPQLSDAESSSQVKQPPSSGSRRSNVSEDSEDSEPPKKKRRLHRRNAIEIVTSSDEDVSRLADEVEEERILNTRLRTREKTDFQRNLEKLKKRKLKLPDETSESEDEASTRNEESTHRLFKGSKPSNQFEDDDNISDDGGSISEHPSDFIVEDNNAVELPPEFSMETHQDLSHQFKKIYQFFVHVAVQAPKKRAGYMQKQMKDEQYFSVPLQVTRRKLSGLRDSLVASSVWRPEFKNSLEKYPEFEITRLDFAVPSCDACHLGGRLSTLMGRLNGSFYNPCGFKPKKPKNKDEENGKEFHLGRFCAKRTRVFHEFSHWEYDLFQGILREIDQLRSSSSTGFHRLAYTGSKPPTDLEDADALCDWLDKRKMIDMEWQKLKSMMESARHLEMEKEDTAD